MKKFGILFFLLFALLSCSHKNETDYKDLFEQRVLLDAFTTPTPNPQADCVSSMDSAASCLVLTQSQAEAFKRHCNPTYPSLLNTEIVSLNSQIASETDPVKKESLQEQLRIQQANLDLYNRFVSKFPSQLAAYCYKVAGASDTEALCSSVLAAKSFEKFSEEAKACTMKCQGQYFAKQLSSSSCASTDFFQFLLSAERPTTECLLDCFKLTNIEIDFQLLK
ncbi:MAG: hypothetical protein H7A25_21250 [Leptospiraceae bacterium]|nr:hypothetical protein [Leptospiraceae bacterium]MCP5502438.1 hypothetical protein [Leptospiraceae bacterium]